MRLTFFILTICSFLLSCINRNTPVDASSLKDSDYRLFQGTPAWKLAKAVEDDNVSEINEIITKDSSLINYQEPKYGSTLLMLTIRNQQMKPFKALLARKADISIHTTFDGASAIIEACGSKYYDIDFVKTLVEYGANVNDIETGDRKKGNSTRKTPLIMASQTGQLDLVKFLVSKGAEINYQNEFGQSALSESIMRRKYEIAYYLLQNGADYKRPIFYRPDYSIPSEMQDPKDKGRPMYLTDVLKEDVSEFGTSEYVYKGRMIGFLKSKGFNY